VECDSKPLTDLKSNFNFQCLVLIAATLLNNNVLTAQDVLLKQLVPANLAGVILGKGGETITSLQAETGTVMKMSKGNDFYPGN
jgi:hypothetical protein